MFFGRLVGWGLLGLALLLASGDAVLALGPGDRVGLLTGDFWVLLAGRTPQPDSLPASLGTVLLAWPAWTLLAPMGGLLLLTCRQRRRRHRFRGLH
jgi:hypothetical protein